MSIIDGIIIVVALTSILVVIVIIAQSFKRIDKDIIQNIQNNNTILKKGFVSKVKRFGIFLLAWFIERLKQVIQKIHSWIIKEKRKDKSEIMKAKDELEIQHDTHTVSKKTYIEMEKKGRDKTTETVKEGDVLEKVSLRKDNTIIDSAVQKNKKHYDINKKSFIKGLFKRSKSTKHKNIDMKHENDNFSEKWSLTHVSNSEKKEITKNVDKKTSAINTSNDVILGVDRAILEKKILQKIDKDPTSVSNYHELGMLYIKMKKYDDAREVFDYILTIVPNDLEAKQSQDKIRLLQEADN